MRRVRYIQCELGGGMHLKVVNLFLVPAFIYGALLFCSSGGQVDRQRNSGSVISDEREESAPSASGIERGAEKSKITPKDSINIRRDGIKEKDTGISETGSGKPGSFTGERIEKRRKGASGLKAGFADDNRQFNYFIEFLEKYGDRARHYPINIGERIILRVQDMKKLPLPNADVNIYGDGSLLFSGKTYSDGSFPFYPSQYSPSINEYKASIRYKQLRKDIEITRKGHREIVAGMNGSRSILARIPLDIVFIFDTTGSMGEEIERLKRTIELIHLNLSTMPSRPKVRFGLVLYKDRLDEYVTQVVPLTGSLREFQEALARVEASGGGDYPEDLQSALKDAMQTIRWNRDGIRMAFIITDASPHLDYGQEYTYREAVKDARKKGIKIFSVGSGGLTIDGEYVLRQISQYTLGKYIFLTYGEQGESEGGQEGSVSHHTGSNYQTDKLEVIIMRFARDELKNISGKETAIDDEHFTAVKIGSEKREETLYKLFSRAVDQLVDYSSIKVPEGTPAGVLPISASDVSMKISSEYFTEQLVMSLSKNSRFRLVERKGLQAVMKELELTMTGLVDENNAAKVGKLIGAKMLISGKLYKKSGKYELFLKLLRVETAEVLSMTKARIDPDLGLSPQ